MTFSDASLPEHGSFSHDSGLIVFVDDNSRQDPEKSPSTEGTLLAALTEEDTDDESSHVGDRLANQFADMNEQQSGSIIESANVVQRCETSTCAEFTTNWEELGFQSKDQAVLIMQLASSDTTPDERRKLASMFEIKE
jgi:hypothetical protein